MSEFTDKTDLGIELMRRILPDVLAAADGKAENAIAVWVGVFVQGYGAICAQLGREHADGVLRDILRNAAATPLPCDRAERH